MATTPHEAITVVWIFTAIAISLVITRISWRLYSRTSGIDDVVIVISMSLVLATAVLYTAAYGPHTPKVAAAVLNLASATTITLSIGTPKLAVGLLLVRILTVKPWHKTLLVSLATIDILISVGNAIWIWFLFDPPAAAWNPSAYPNARALSVVPYAHLCFALGSYSAFLDLFYAVFPATQFFALQMALRRKVILSVMFGLGLTASVIAWYKLRFVKAIEDGVTSSDIDLLLWATIESNMLHISACIPTLPKFAVFLAQRIRTIYQTVLYTVGKSDSKATSQRIGSTDMHATKLHRAQAKGGADVDVEMHRLTSTVSGNQEDCIVKKVDIETAGRSADDW